MVHGFTKEGSTTNKISGFYVDSSNTGVSSSTVGISDLIVRTQGVSVDAYDLSRQILLAPNQFTVTVLRDNKEVEILVEKIKVK